MDTRPTPIEWQSMPDVARSVILGEVLKARRARLVARLDVLEDRARTEGFDEVGRFLCAVRAELESAGMKDLRCGFRLFREWLDGAERHLRVVS